jgi:nicotinamide-nucleotide amidase
MIDSNMQQAMLPANCELLWNRSGTAPGMWFYENDVVYVSMPGVPFEMKTIFEEEVIPLLKKTFSFPSIVHRTIQTCSIGESFLAKKIEDIENDLPPHIKLAYLPSVGSVRLRFSAYGDNESELNNELNPIINKLYDRIGDYIYGEGNDSLAQVVGALLNSQSKTLATAESCTGGYIAHLITSIPGSSNYYLGSVIAYHNKIKMEQLNIPESLLIEHGAVSEACVIKMAEEIRLKTGADYAISSSGIAGPSGGTESKPVGTVWIGFASESKSFGRIFNMGDNRERTILRTALMALDILRKELLVD